MNDIYRVHIVFLYISIPLRKPDYAPKMKLVRILFFTRYLAYFLISVLDLACEVGPHMFVYIGRVFVLFF